MPFGSPITATLAAAAGISSIFLTICALYVVISFALLWRTVPPPPFGSRLRIMTRELVLAALVQPLLPLFYLVGRKLGGGQGQPIVFVHGYFQNRADFLAIARHFRKNGLGPLYGFNYPWMASTAHNVERLARFVATVCAETKQPTVDLVAHSMGGIVCLEYIADETHRTRVRRCVTVASPHAGVLWAGPMIGAASREIRATSNFLVERRERPIAVPCLSLFSAADNVVFPMTTSALTPRGGTDHEAPLAGHFSILFEPSVMAAAANFLAESDAAVVQDAARGERAEAATVAAVPHEVGLLLSGESAPAPDEASAEPGEASDESDETDEGAIAEVDPAAGRGTTHA
jgi:triacylglycerol lipase